MLEEIIEQRGYSINSPLALDYALERYAQVVIAQYNLGAPLVI